MTQSTQFRPLAIGAMILLALALGATGLRAASEIQTAPDLQKASEIQAAPGSSAQLERHGVLILRWLERPNPHGPSTTAAPGDRVRFTKFLSYDHNQNKDFAAARASLREGDVIAYRMPRNAARRAALTGHLNALGYDLLEYGHLAIVVQAAAPTSDTSTTATAVGLRLFSSESFIGPNTREGLETLEKHDWDAYRLDQWNRVDLGWLHEFVGLVEKKAGHWYGYDFSGMFGLWNSNLRPATPKKIGHEYICSTVVLAALYYSGVQLDAVRNDGYLDICTPLQVVSSPGRITNPPNVMLATADAPTTGTISVSGKKPQD